MPPRFTKLNFNIYCDGVIWAHRLIPPSVPFVALIIFKFILKYVGLSSYTLLVRSRSSSRNTCFQMLRDAKRDYKLQEAKERLSR